MRKASLPALLVVEVALVVALRTQGWLATTSSIWWAGSLLAAMIPVLAAALLLFRRGLRFDLRSLLIAVALVAVFLLITVLPLLDANRARRGSRGQIAAGAVLHTNSWLDHYPKLLNLKLRDDPAPNAPAVRELPPWLMRLAPHAVETPRDESIRMIFLASDAQISELCQAPERFSNLECISVHSGISLHGLELFLATMPRFPKAIALQFCDLAVPNSAIDSLATIESLSIAARRKPPSGRLPQDQLHAISRLPKLRVLSFSGYAVNDGDLSPLAQCKSLRRLCVQNTAVTRSRKGRPGSIAA